MDYILRHPSKIVHDNGSAFINRDFVNWTREIGITLAPRTAYSPWTNAKVEVQNKHLEISPTSQGIIGQHLRPSLPLPIIQV